MKIKREANTFPRTIGSMQSKPVYFLGLLLAGVEPFLFNLLMSLFFLRMFNAAEVGDWATLWAALLQTSLLFVGITIVGVIANYLFEYPVTITTAAFRRQTFDQIQNLPFHYFQEHHSGDLISRVTNDLKNLENVYSQNLLSIVRSVLGGVASLVIMFSLNWQLASFVVCLGLFFALINSRFIGPLRQTSDQVQSGLGKLTEALSNILASSNITRVFGLERHLTEQYEKQNQSVLSLAERRVKQNAWMNAINFLTGFMGFGGLMVIGGFFVLQGRATFGEIVFMVQMQNGVDSLFNQLGNQITQMQTALAGARRVLSLLDSPQEPVSYDLSTTDAVGGTDADQEDYQQEEIAVEVKDVSFQYPDGSPIFKNLSFRVPRNKVYALVGPSGGGKSTVFKLLLGFYPPDRGDIRLNGRSLKGTPLQELRDLTAYVPQDSYLFSGTIAENIAYGNETASRQEIEEAARAAFAHDFIVNLPDGYETMVGERGAHLSGGQRQRIAIARAILKGAPILLLDEATSALDAESELLVQKALEQLMVGKTTLVIAHRLSTIERADRILVIDRGSVVETGTHQELLADPQSMYSYLYNLQFASTEKQAG